MNNTRKNLLIALCGALIVCLIMGSGLLRRPDKWVQDTLFQQPGVTSGDIILIGIDEEALTELGPYHTWDRNIMASALEALGADPDRMPAVVAVDTLYAGNSDPAADARLAEAAARLPIVITASMADFGAEYTADGSGGVNVNSSAVLRFEQPYEALRAVTRQGHINAWYDMDGIMRHALLYITVRDPDGQGQHRVCSMAFETARAFLESRGVTEVPQPETDARGTFYISYTGQPGAYYDGYSLARLVKGELPADVFAGKIVMIGPYSAGLEDAYFTPIKPSEQMNGVEIQANVVQAVLEGRFIREAPDWPQLLILGALSFLAMLLFLRSGVWQGGLIAAALAVLGLLAGRLIYSLGWLTHPLWLPAAALLLYAAAVVRHYISAALAHQRVTRTFERYVAPEIVKEILKDPETGKKLGGRLCNIAVLFVDIRGFTSMSERLQPEQVVQILNRYLTVTSSCVERNRGTLDKFVGDATMAFWGAPLPVEDPVTPAARTALEIVKETRELSDRLKEETGEVLHVGIGIHYGPAVVGNMGSERRMDYTAIGDTVNTSARLEANAPGDTVYISRSVADALGGRARTEPLAEPLRLKGKAEGFEVLKLLALDEQESE